MDFTVTAAAIATLTSAVVSALVALMVCWFNTKKQDHAKLVAMLDKMIDFSIQYPYLEDSDFCNKWTPEAKDENSMRYDNFCCFVFNYLERLWEFYDGKGDKMYKHVNYIEIIALHGTWWKSRIAENTDGYKPDFVDFVNKILKA